jgi:hypothetical protein
MRGYVIPGVDPRKHYALRKGQYGFTKEYRYNYRPQAEARREPGSKITVRHGRGIYRSPQRIPRNAKRKNPIKRLYPIRVGARNENRCRHINKGTGIVRNGRRRLLFFKRATTALAYLSRRWRIYNIRGDYHLPRTQRRVLRLAKKISRPATDGRRIYPAETPAEISTDTRGTDKSETTIGVPKKGKTTEPSKAVETAREGNGTARKNIELRKTDR